MPFSKTIPVKFVIILPVMMLFFSCKKATTTVPPPPVTGGPTDTSSVTPVSDPAVENTMGFFLNDWKPKTFIAPPFTNATPPSTAAVTVTIDASSIITKIPLSEFGHNSVWWMGNPSNQALSDIKNLHPHIIRFPGGNASNNYFWNEAQDVLPADVPATLIDNNGNIYTAGYNYGNTSHNWEFTLQNYYDMLAVTGNQGIISINYAYARYSTAANPVASAAHLAADWVRYDNGRTQYWEIGNEHYGDWQAGYRIDLTKNKDGQPEFITGALYAQHAKVFIDSMQKAATEIGKKIYIGVVMFESAPQSWETTTMQTWNQGLLTQIADKEDFFVGHNYVTPYGQNSDAATVFSSALAAPADMLNFMKQDMISKGAVVKPIAFDEWNMWAQNSKQQVSNSSGVFAVIVQGESIFNKFGMTARWDLLNGWSNGNDHGLFSAGDEPGISKWNPRPSFYYMYYFEKYLGDRMVPSIVQGSSDIKAYSSSYSSGEAAVAMVNISATAQSVEIKKKNIRFGSRYYWYSLQGGTDNGEFSGQVFVNGFGPTGNAGGPSDYFTISANTTTTASGVKVTVPARGAVFLVVEKGK